MPHRHSRHDPFGARHTLWFTAASGVLLVLCWALGGVTVDSTGADELLQLLSLPVLLLAAWRLTQVPITRTVAIALILAAAVVLVPLWQLLPRMRVIFPNEPLSICCLMKSWIGPPRCM